MVAFKQDLSASAGAHHAVAEIFEAGLAGGREGGCGEKDENNELCRG